MGIVLAPLVLCVFMIVIVSLCLKGCFIYIYIKLYSLNLLTYLISHSHPTTLNSKLAKMPNIYIYIYRERERERERDGLRIGI